MSLSFDRFFGLPGSPTSKKHFLAAGCSHTSAVGVEPNQSWPQQLARLQNTDVYNLAEPGGNAWIASVRISQRLNLGRPEYVVVQWPHPVRKVIWQDNIGRCFNAHSIDDDLFQRILRRGELNFWAEWMQSIITTNTACRLANIPCINFSIDAIDIHYKDLLAANGIKLYDDSSMWPTDWLASDGKHHSRRCHAAWSTKLQEIINATSTR